MRVWKVAYIAYGMIHGQRGLRFGGLRNAPESAYSLELQGHVS